MLIPYDEFERLERLDEKEVVYRFDRLLERRGQRSEGLSATDVTNDVERATAEVRRDR